MRQIRPRVDQLEPRLVLSSLHGTTTTVASQFQAPTLPGGDASTVSTDLLLGYDQHEGVALSQSLQSSAASEVSTLMTDAQGRVEVDITTGQAASLAPVLTAMGADVVSILPQYNQDEAYIPWSKLPAISNLGSRGLMGIIGVNTPMVSVGSVTSEGVNVVEADRVQNSTPGYNGAGVTVGALSDSYDDVQEPVVTVGGTTYKGAAADVETGDLPNNVNVIQDLSSGGTDEGRAMLQIVHDVAPGASLAFATADISEGQFAANIQNLANAGAKVINDDITYFDEPYFQPGIVAQAVNNVVTNDGVSYFAAAGNLDTQAYDSASPLAYGSNPLNFYADTISGISSSAQSYYNFNPSGTATDKQTITLTPGQAIELGLQWDQPFYTTNGVTNQLNIYLLNTSGQVVAESTTNTIQDQEPFQFLGYQNGGTSANYEIVIQLAAGSAPGELKYVNFGANDFGDVNFGTFATNSATINPHAASPDAMGVGAVPFFEQTTPEPFSSFGPATFLFDANGNRLSSPQVVAKPNIVAPDGVSTTFFGGDDINGYPNFFGTSAATPHAAGVAALILEANPTWTPSQVYSDMETTADPNIGTGNVDQVGSGLINAYQAIFGSPVPVSADFADNFASGAMGLQWQLYQSGAGRIQVTTANNPPSGDTYQVVMDASIQPTTPGYVYTFPQLDEATLNVNLAGRQDVTLQFDQQWFNSFGVPVTAMPSTFTGHNDSNGVAFSVNGGTTWYRITSLGSTSSTPYQTDSFDLSTIASGLGLTLTSDTLIKFQEYNRYSVFAPELGLGLDNVKVSALSVLSSTTIDDGLAQRSAVRSITLTFQGNITTIPSSAFQLTRNEDGLTIPVNVGTPVYMGGETYVLLTFGGPNLDGTSVPDGRYTLTINGSLILDNFGNEVDAAGNGTAGSTGTVNFFRFFGDSNGDGIVNATDYLAFRTAYLSGVVTPANSFFDYNGDGEFTVIDLDAFVTNFTKRTLA